MIAALILPSSQIDDMTVDTVVHEAMQSGLVACNRMTGPFRIAFFERHHIPAGWSRIGLTEVPPCAA